MLCMHSKFMEKYALVVAANALEGRVFEQKKPGVPLLKSFEGVRDLACSCRKT